MVVNKVFTMRRAFQKQKSSQISLRADCHSWRSGLGWQTLCGVNRCNDLAKMPKLQFVATAPFLPLYIVVTSLNISLKNVLIAPQIYGTERNNNRNNRNKRHFIPCICYFNKSAKLYSPLGILATLRYSLIASTKILGLAK